MMSKNIIEGKWRSFREDLLIRYNNTGNGQGMRRMASVEYLRKIDRKGRLSAKVWDDRNQNGRRDSREPIVAKYKADAAFVGSRIDFNSREVGTFLLDKKRDRFSLFYEGTKFAVGTILDRDYFF